MMDLWTETVEELASEFSEDICRVWNEHHGYKGWPPEEDYQTALLTLEALSSKVGEENFQKIVSRWEQALIPGLDY